MYLCSVHAGQNCVQAAQLQLESRRDPGSLIVLHARPVKCSQPGFAPASILGMLTAAETSCRCLEWHGRQILDVTLLCSHSLDILGGDYPGQ